jgi:hypothetical protein
MEIFRTITPHIEKCLSRKGKRKVLIIYGPRQAGKTTLVKYLIEKYPGRSEYFNCDYLDVRETFAHQNASKILSLVKNLELAVIDEAQRIENIGLTLKILADEHPSVQVVATGSSSFDLSNKISEPLTGRKREFHLHPLSFAELHGQDSPLAQERALDRFLRFGGYPEVALQNEQEARHTLKELAGSYLFKDIFTFQHLKKPEMLMKLLRLLAFQIGSEVSFHELAQGLGVDQTVVQKYIHLLEEAFVVFRIGAFRRNLRSEVGKSRKIFFWDTGVRNAVIENFNALELRNDVGALWENFCVAERLKHISNQQEFLNSYFWRTYSQKEIDYLEESGGKLRAYEFKWSKTKRSAPPREFMDAYPGSGFETITPDNFSSFLTV